MNPAPLVILILSIWGAVLDSRYKRNGGKKPTRLTRKILFSAALLVVALFVMLMVFVRLKPGREENFVHAISELTTVMVILLFGAWELGRCLVRSKHPLPDLPQDRMGRESRRGLKLAILAVLVAVLGYLGLREQDWIPHTSVTTITAQQPHQQQSTTQSVPPPKGEDQAHLDNIDLYDLEMKPVTTRAITGDVRPFYLVSGRIENRTGKALTSVTIRIFVQSIGSPAETNPHYNKDWQSYDEADVHVDGPIHDGTKGFSQQIQVLPPRGKPWAFEAGIVDAKVDTKAE